MTNAPKSSRRWEREERERSRSSRRGVGGAGKRVREKKMLNEMK